MSSGSEQTRILMTKCPRCNKTLSLRIDLSLLEYEGGIAKVAIFHGSPPHSLILYIDKKGMIRGVEVAEFVVLMDRGSREIPLEETEKMRESLGSESLSAILSSYIANVPLYVISQTHPTIFKRVLGGVLGEFFTKPYIVSNTLAEDFKVVIVDDHYYRNFKDKIIGLVFDMQSGLLLNNVNLKYMRKLVNKFLGGKKLGLKQLKKEIEDLKGKYEMLIEEVESFINFFKVIKGSTRRISLKKLKSRFNLSNSETRYLVELIKIKNYDAYSVIKDDIGVF